jgi:hypothetical protein
VKRKDRKDFGQKHAVFFRLYFGENRLHFQALSSFSLGAAAFVESVFLLD